MEKLIELINKWQEETHPDGIYLPVFAYRDGIFWSDSDCLSSVMDEIHLISKPCGFIGWLVENEKIDNKKIADETYVKVNGELYEVILGCHYDLYQQTLMLLSISDTPIDDLISYLK